MGLKGAPSYFQQQMQSAILGDLLHNICEIYLDDIIIYGKDEKEFLKNLDTVLARLERGNITLNPAKAKIGVSAVEYVGHVIDENGLNMSQKKRDQVQEFRRPETQKGMKSFLGLVQQFRPHLRGYETYGHILTSMTKGYNKRQDKELVWSEEAIAAFERLQTDVVNCPPLYFRDQTSPIFLHTDASNFGIGAYLFQLVKDEEGNDQEQIVAILSKTLSGSELNWSTIEKEAYAIFFAFHNSIEFLQMPNNNQKILY